MYVSVERPVVGAFDNLADALTSGPENWMPGMFASATAQITKLEAETPMGRRSWYVQIELEPSERQPDEVVVPIRWHALDAGALFPVFEGRLCLRRFPDGTKQLAIEGSYEPPGGLLGAAADEAAMSLVAEESIVNFVEGIAGVLSRNALGRTVDAEVTAGKLTLSEDA